MPQINLESYEVPIREERLGAITGYQGTIADLAQRSRQGTLQERNRTFTQCATCSSGCATCQVAMIQDAAVVNHAPLGCAGDFAGFNDANRYGQYLRGWPISTIKMLSTNLREDDTVFGGTAKLQVGIREAYRRFAPKAIFVTASCVSGIIGEDIEGVVAELETELGIPIVAIHCEGFRSQVWASGFDASYHAILRKIVKPAQRKRPELVNIINFWGTDIFTEMFGELGLVPNYVTPFTTVGQLERLSEAAATVQICSTLGSYLGAGLEQHFGVPEVKAPPPFGLAGTDAWLRELGRVTGREAAVEAYITATKERIAPELAQFRQELAGVRGYVAAGAVHGHGIINVLKELGLNVIASCAWHHDQHFDNNDTRADSLQHIVHTYGDVDFTVCNKQAYELVNQLRKLRPDVFICRHRGMTVWGAKLGIPTFLIGDEHFGLGYQGLLKYGQVILDAVRNPSFYQKLAQHTRLPYTDWWLQQEPCAFLEGAPEGATGA